MPVVAARVAGLTAVRVAAGSRLASCELAPPRQLRDVPVLCCTQSLHWGMNGASQSRHHSRTLPERSLCFQRPSPSKRLPTGTECVGLPLQDAPSITKLAYVQSGGASPQG